MTASASPPMVHDDTSNSARKAPLGVKFKLLYGSGALIDGISNGALSYFLLFYLTSVCGLSGTQAGTALLVGLLIDSIGDPVIGLLSDNTQSKTGRRYPYLLYSTVPVALMFGLLFSIPTWMTGVPLFLYASICAMALRIGLSLFILPHVAVGAEVTEDYHERSSIVSYRIPFSMLGTFLVIGLGLGVFMAGPEGLVHRAAYAQFAWTCAGIMAVAGLVAARATRQVLPRLHASQPSEGHIVTRFVRELGEIFRNRSFVVLFLAVLAFFVAQGAAGALALYLNRYFWNLSAGSVQLVLIGATLGPFIGVPVAALAVRKIEKKTLVIVSFVTFVLCQAWPPLAGIAGLMPANESVLGILFANALLGGAALVAVAISAQSMMADAADEHEFLFGVRREGLFFSGLTLAVKAATGLGGFIAGSALDFIRFPIEIVKQGGNLQLSEATVRNLGLIGGPLPAVITLLAPIALLAYSLSRKKHAAILEELDNRRHRDPLVQD